MSDAQPIPPDNDEELKQALAAAFGEEAMCLLDDDEDAFPDEWAVSLEDEDRSTSSGPHPSCFLEDGVDDDASPLIRYVKQLSRAIYGDGLAAFPNTDHHPTDAPRCVPRAPRFVVFVVGDQQFAVPLGDVREIARYPKVTALPRTPPWLRGVTNLRGQILSVTDLRSLLGISGHQPDCGEAVIIVHGTQIAASTAIVADRVLGIRGIDEQQGDTSDLSERLAAIAKGTATSGEATTVLIDIDQLFGCAELTALAF